jgi:O-antigen ligase
MKANLSTYILYAAVACIPFDIVFNAGVARVTAIEILFSLAFALWLLRVVRRRERLTLAPYVVPLLFFLAACLLSLAKTQNAVLTLRETVQFAWLFGVLYFLAHEVKERAMALTLWSLVVAAGTVVALVGLYQYFFVREPVHFLIAETRLRAHGLFDQPNPFGSYLIGILPFLLGFYFLAEMPSQQADERPGLVYKIFFNKTLLLILLFIISAAVVATFSRGSWVGLACGLILLYYFLRKKARSATFILLVGVISVAGALVVADVAYQPAVVERSFSNRQRTLLAATAVSMFRDHPVIGVGFGNFPARLPEYASAELVELMHRDYDATTKTWFTNPEKESDIELVHNTLLQVAAETGLIGLVAFVWLFFAYYRHVIKMLHRSVDFQEYCIRVAMLASVTAILAAGMFGWPFSHGVQEVLMTGMALAISPQTQARHS